jgi:hypothetical protein
VIDINPHFFVIKSVVDTTDYAKTCIAFSNNRVSACIHRQSMSLAAIMTKAQNECQNMICMGCWGNCQINGFDEGMNLVRRA